MAAVFSGPVDWWLPDRLPLPTIGPAVVTTWLIVDVHVQPVVLDQGALQRPIRIVPTPGRKGRHDGMGWWAHLHPLITGWMRLTAGDDEATLTVEGRVAHPTSSSGGGRLQRYIAFKTAAAIVGAAAAHLSHPMHATVRGDCGDSLHRLQLVVARTQS